MPDPDPFVVKSLGRISGMMLTDNLLRHGVDLAFDNDLLYLKVSPQLNQTVVAGSFEPGQTYQIKTLGTNFVSIGAASNTIGLRFTATGIGTGTGTAYFIKDDKDPNPEVSAGTGIGVNEDNPVYDLDIDGTSNATNLSTTNNATLDNLLMQGAGTITSVVGAVNIMPMGPNPIIFHDRVITANLEFNDNFIGSFSNSNINFDPSGAGPVNLLATTNVTGDVNATGNIQITGNLSKQGNIIIGNDVFVADGIADDTVTINTDFTQSIIPGTDNFYDMGRSNRRWAEVHIPDISNVNNAFINSAIIGTQLQINGLSRTIFALQSNDDVFLTPDTGITVIEDIQFQDNTITNLLNTPVTFTPTGNGYLKFNGTNGFVIPSGTSAERPGSPELGDTRWNTDLGILECFDGSVYVVSTGGGATVTQDLMSDLGHIYTLMWG